MRSMRCVRACRLPAHLSLVDLGWDRSLMAVAVGGVGFGGTALLDGVLDQR